jgi:hypothetical protein
MDQTICVMLIDELSSTSQFDELNKEIDQIANELFQIEYEILNSEYFFMFGPYDMPEY